MTHIRPIDSFEVITDQGNRYTVERLQNVLPHDVLTSRGLSHQKPPAALLTTCGLTVEEIDRDTYEIIDTGEIAERVG